MVADPSVGPVTGSGAWGRGVMPAIRVPQFATRSRRSLDAEISAAPRQYDIQSEENARSYSRHAAGGVVTSHGPNWD